MLPELAQKIAPGDHYVSREQLATAVAALPAGQQTGPECPDGGRDPPAKGWDSHPGGVVGVLAFVLGPFVAQTIAKDKAFDESDAKLGVTMYLLKAFGLPLNLAPPTSSAYRLHRDV